jgi:hypothetical protein
MASRLASVANNEVETAPAAAHLKKHLLDRELDIRIPFGGEAEAVAC